MSKGRKIEEYGIEGRTAVLRFDAHTLVFTLEVEGRTFEGETPKELKLQAQAFLRGHDKLEWRPVIAVETSPYASTLELRYHRYFEADNGEKKLYRRWRVPGVVGSDGSAFHTDTADMTEGQPGDVDHGPRLKERMLPYTPERWKALRDLEKAIQAALEAARAKLEKILSEGDLDAFLENAGRRGPQTILFGPEKGTK